MRTTINLDAHLIAQFKRRAAEQGTSVSSLVEQAVRLFVRRPRTAPPSLDFELITFGEGQSFSRCNIDKASALLEADDLDRFASGR